jgi:hypothetical protein
MTATYEKIATTTLGSTATTVTFSSISGAYTDLVVVYNGTTSSGGSILMRFNGDTGGNYSWTYMFGDGSTAYSGRNSSQTFSWFTDSVVSGGSTTYPAQVVMNLNNYSNTTTYKSWLYRLDQVTTSNGAPQAHIGLWRSTSAINQISFYNTTMQIGTTFTLYGIKAE